MPGGPDIPLMTPRKKVYDADGEQPGDRARCGDLPLEVRLARASARVITLLRVV
jgi:hypothetical protein